jgi:hypothetical protein
LINPDDLTPENFVPIEELMPGLKLMKLPDGYTALEVVCNIKSLDAEGHIAWVQRWSRGLHIIEVTGASGVMHALNLRSAIDLYEPEEGD